MNNIFRVNLSERSVNQVEVPESYQALGGRALTSQIIYDEVKPTSHPLGENNKLVFAPGLLSGTRAPSSGRLSVGSISPLTKGIKESNSGGTAAQDLAKLGLKALVIEGKAEQDNQVLVIDKDGVRLEEDNSLAGLGNYEVGDKLRQKYGEKVTIMSIGPAGEYKMTAASIAVTDTDDRPVRAFGRGGLGAVMGAKGLKAIVIDDEGAPGVELTDEDAFKEASRKFSKIILDHPVSGEALRNYGTAVLINILNEAGGLPTENFRSGRFETANKISGETMTETIKERDGKPGHSCHPGCIMGCSNVYHDDKGEYLTAGFEYETIWAFGAHCNIDDLDYIAYFDRCCDDLGLDTIETGVTFGVFMETDMIEFGDKEEVKRIFDEEIRKGTPLGQILGSGSETTGRVFGIDRVPTVKRQSIPAYDPRAVKGVGVTYATSTQGADHTAGYSVTANILKVGGEINPLKKEGQVDLSRDLQVATASIDSTGLCLFVAFAVLDSDEALPTVVDMINAQYGTNLTVDDVNELGQQILNVERKFNEKAGFTKAHDRLPEFFEKEELPPHDVKFDLSEEELDSLYNFS
ncbi:aldehyde ferredoxin oxidoreductase family protein [Natranaerobius thermophilus]|uniref:Aldehyde ferredoxin oxidoreductase n=1 Tax=Natranaerobius thermophilus (strain ATCC BAA-1301 / DSM 18059 / JW/NM-WN-LF) TaxID=457570 RepID=B2A7W4_NATTJ|nr:aldehyde ferredoxin oxidoreductase C-terminal domain-containing protein [Natranaerobius thermophilus]ACB84412.1 Aldehyde ferredoxin oxidoreductase [Natranaerobius thermophilus JW/NM-WN-LF]